MIGRTYLLAGQPVTVRTAFRLPSKAHPLPICPTWLWWHHPPKGAPRNVLIEHANGCLTVRPFPGVDDTDRGELLAALGLTWEQAAPLPADEVTTPKAVA